RPAAMPRCSRTAAVRGAGSGLIGALVISPRRQVRAYFGSVPDADCDGESILAFLRQLRSSVRSPIELLWDWLLAHRGEPIASSQVRYRARLRIHLLAPYAPELNPVELIWG